MPLKLMLPALLTIFFMILTLSSGLWSSKFGIQLSSSGFINGHFNYQMGILLITILSLGITYWASPENFNSIFRWGDLKALGHEVKWMGIKEGDSWLKTGASLSVVITMVTGIFLYFQLKGKELDWSSLLKVLGFIILFSLTNSFAEEVIFRLGLVVPYLGRFQPTTIAVISALIFGIAHLNGTPGGMWGILLSGVLGYILTLSMIETRGLFWPWFIHFLQDVVIFSALFLLHQSKSLG